MPPCGTFDYVAVVPSAARIDGGLTLDATLREPVDTGSQDFVASELFEDRLLGYAPRLTIFWQQVVLTASGSDHSLAREAVFEVDRGFIGLLQPADRVHVVRTETADLAVSVLRDEELVVAFGALGAVPLGPSFSVVSTFDDVEISLANETERLRPSQSVNLGRYTASVLRCLEHGMPGHCECVALTRGDVDTEHVGYRCALLLAGRYYRDPLNIADWPDRS